VEWAFHTIDTQAVTEEIMGQVLHSIQKAGKNAIDSEEEDMQNKFDMHLTYTSAEGTATPTTKTTEDSD
jgi:hypothetical protein